LSSIDGGTARTLRDRPLGKILVLAALLVVALLVARTCGATHAEVTEAQAIAIAKEQIDYTPDLVQVRLLRQGIKSRAVWAVSLSKKRQNGDLYDITVVTVDARTGAVSEIRHSNTP
jgi:hypothetical protein